MTKAERNALKEWICELSLAQLADVDAETKRARTHRLCVLFVEFVDGKRDARSLSDAVYADVVGRIHAASDAAREAAAAAASHACGKCDRCVQGIGPCRTPRIPRGRGGLTLVEGGSK